MSPFWSLSSPTETPRFWHPTPGPAPLSGAHRRRELSPKMGSSSGSAGYFDASTAAPAAGEEEGVLEVGDRRAVAVDSLGKFAGGRTEGGCGAGLLLGGLDGVFCSVVAAEQRLDRPKAVHERNGNERKLVGLALRQGGADCLAGCTDGDAVLGDNSANVFRGKSTTPSRKALPVACSCSKTRNARGLKRQRKRRCRRPGPSYVRTSPTPAAWSANFPPLGWRTDHRPKPSNRPPTSTSIP